MFIKADQSTMIAEASGPISAEPLQCWPPESKQAETYDSCEVFHHNLTQLEKTGSHGKRIPCHTLLIDMI